MRRFEDALLGDENDNWMCRWLLNGSEMSGERSDTLLLDSVSRELSGRRVTCEATNSVGTARLDYVLEVECKPPDSLTASVAA